MKYCSVCGKLSNFSLGRVESLFSHFSFDLGMNLTIIDVQISKQIYENVSINSHPIPCGK